MILKILNARSGIAENRDLLQVMVAGGNVAPSVSLMKRQLCMFWYVRTILLIEHTDRCFDDGCMNLRAPWNKDGRYFRYCVQRKSSFFCMYMTRSLHTCQINVTWHPVTSPRYQSAGNAPHVRLPTIRIQQSVEFFTDTCAQDDCQMPIDGDDKYCSKRMHSGSSFPRLPTI